MMMMIIIIIIMIIIIIIIVVVVVIVCCLVVLEYTIAVAPYAICLFRFVPLFITTSVDNYTLRNETEQVLIM